MEKEWFETYRSWLAENVISKITDDETIIEAYLSNQAMCFWLAAVTHEAVDGKNNYEKFELLGDSVLRTAMIRYIINLYPDMTLSELDYLKTQYVSNVFFSTISQDIGLTQFARIPGYINEDRDMSYSVAADLFESIFGCLYMLTEGIQKFNTQEVCNTLLLDIMKTRPLDTSSVGGPSKSTAISFFNFHNAPDLVDIEDADDTSSRVYVYITRDMQNYFTRVLKSSIVFESNPAAVELKNSSPRIHDKGMRYAPTGSMLIGYGEDSITSRASDRAYTLTVEYLTLKGITREWFRAVKNTMDLRNPEIKEQYLKVKTKLDVNGYIATEFIKSQKLSNDARQIIMLWGIKEDGSRDLLATAAGTGRTKYTKAALFDAYAKGLTYIDIRSKVAEEFEETL